MPCWRARPTEAVVSLAQIIILYTQKQGRSDSREGPAATRAGPNAVLARLTAVTQKCRGRPGDPGRPLMME